MATRAGTGENREEGSMVAVEAPALGATPCPAPISICCSSDKSSAGESYVNSQPLNMAKKDNGSQPGGGDRKKKVPLDSQTLATLKASYLTHFPQYCKGKTGKVQKVPTKVWHKVYEDYVKELERSCMAKGISPPPDSERPSQRQMQDALRENINSETTGVSDPKDAETIVVQPEDVLDEILASDGHQRRSMIQMRDDWKEKGPPASGDARSAAGGGGSQSGKKIIEEQKPRETRQEIQSRAANALQKMADSMEKTGSATLSVLREQVEVANQKFPLSTADSQRKVELTELQHQENKRKAEQHESDMLQKKLKHIAFLRDNHVLTEDEFQEPGQEQYLADEIIDAELLALASENIRVEKMK